MKVYCRMRRNTFALIFFFVTILFLNNAHGNHEGETPPIILEYRIPDRDTIHFNQRVGTIIQRLNVEGASRVQNSKL